MKSGIKYIVAALFVLFGASAVSGQHYIGVKGGYGGAMGRFNPKYESSMVWNKHNVGVMWKYYSDQQVVGGVSAELEYQKRGYRLFEGIVSDTTAYTAKTRVVNSVTLPLIWQPHLYLMNRRVRVFASLGFTVTYNLGIGDTFTVTDYTVAGEVGHKIQTSTSKTTDYVMQTARDNRWNYGFLGGFGVGVLFGRWEVFAEGRYYYGMSDILRDRIKYIFNEQRVFRSELDNLFVNVGVYFRIGKGGITERPLGKRGHLPASATDFRNVGLPF